MVYFQRLETVCHPAKLLIDGDGSILCSTHASTTTLAHWEGRNKGGRGTRKWAGCFSFRY